MDYQSAASIGKVIIPSEGSQDNLVWEGGGGGRANPSAITTSCFSEKGGERGGQ